MASDDDDSDFEAMLAQIRAAEENARRQLGATGAPTTPRALPDEVEPIADAPVDDELATKLARLRVLEAQALRSGRDDPEEA